MSTQRKNILLRLLIFSFLPVAFAADITTVRAPMPIGGTGPKAGSAAPDFALKTLDGKTVKGSDLWRAKPMVVMTASHTCPVFRNATPRFESLVKEFGARANFVVIYTIEAHPKGDPSPYSGKEWVTPANEKMNLLIPQPRTQDERNGRARECVEGTRLGVPVVVDSMDNATWKAYGSAPNCGYLIGTDGKVIVAQPWFDAGPMRNALEKLSLK